MHTRIKQLRKTLSLNQSEFGSRLGVTQTAVTAWESGTRILRDAIIQSICREFHVNEAWLRTGEGEMFVSMDRYDELMEAAGRFFATETDEFRLRFVRSVLTFGEAEWEALERYCKYLTGDN